MRLIESSVESIKKKLRCQYIAGILTNLVVVSSGMHYGWSSHYLPQLESGNYTFQITQEDSSYLAVMPMIGQIFGAIPAAFIANYIGRKISLIFSCLPLIASWIFIGSASSVIPVYVGRFIAGVSDGMLLTLVPMYLGEIASSRIRGILLSLCPVAIVAGVLLQYFFGANLSMERSAFISVLLPIIFLLTFPWMCETPYYYFMISEKEKALTSLQILRGCDNVSDEFVRISSAVEEQNEKKGKWLELFTVRCNRKGLFICVGLRVFQQLTGSTVILFYNKTIFDETGGFISSNNASLIYAAAQLFFCAVSSLTVELLGRRPLLIISLSGTSVALLGNAIFLIIKHCSSADIGQFSFVPLLALLCFTVTYSIGMQVIPFVIIGEIFPTNTKAFALCIMDVLYGLVVTLVSQLFYWSNSKFGMHIPFLFFSLCCIVGIAFVILFVPETKGKTLEDIQTELQTQKQDKIPPNA